MEYENHMESLQVTRGPDKKEYIPGEIFNPNGMVITATYYDGSRCPLPLEDFDYYPSKNCTLTANDKVVTFTHREENLSVKYYGLKVDDNQYWFNDRRAVNQRENMYLVTYVDSNGNPTKDEATNSDQRYIRLELADGVSEGDLFKGTPLNAATFNKIIKAWIE